MVHYVGGGDRRGTDLNGSGSPTWQISTSSFFPTPVDHLGMITSREKKTILYNAGGNSDPKHPIMPAPTVRSPDADPTAGIVGARKLAVGEGK